MNQEVSASSQSCSLRGLHPSHIFLVPAALALSSALLFTGLSLPLLHSQKIFWKSEYSVWAGVMALWHQNEWLLAMTPPPF